MKKNIVNFWMNILIFVNFFSMIFTGVLLFRFPYEASERTILGITRYDWGDIHWMLSFIFIILIFAHLVAQDTISIPLSLILAVLSLLFLKHPAYKTFIAILGLTGYFFYGYGLYAMQGQYTSIYLIYLAVFGLSIYSMIWGLTSFDPEKVKQTRLPGALRMSISIFLIVILLVLVPVWLLRITPDIAKHIPGDTYAVFILDLCVVFPAFGIIAAKLLRNKPLGNILAGVALFKTLTICLSVAFGEWFVPLREGFQVDYGMITIFSALTVLSFGLIVLYMLNLKKEKLLSGQ